MEPKILLLSFILPTDLRCGKLWLQRDHWPKSFRCGCPTCLHLADLQLVFDWDDFQNMGLKRAWRKRIVSMRVAGAVPETVVEGYEYVVED